LVLPLFLFFAATAVVVAGGWVELTPVELLLLGRPPSLANPIIADRDRPIKATVNKTIFIMADLHSGLHHAFIEISLCCELLCGNVDVRSGPTAGLLRCDSREYRAQSMSAFWTWAEAEHENPPFAFMIRNVAPSNPAAEQSRRKA
jgi:hypothetical protein